LLGVATLNRPPVEIEEKRANRQENEQKNQE